MRKTTCGVTIGTGLLVAGLVLLSCGDDSTSPKDPDIDVSPTNLQFTVQEGGSSNQTLTVSNAGDATLNVSSISDDAAWLTESPTSFTVGAGSSQSVTVTASADSLAASSYSGTIAIASNDPDEPTVTVSVALTMTTESQPDIDVTPTSLSMTAQEGSNATAMLTVRNVGTATLSVTSVTDNQTWLSENPTSFTVGAGSSQSVTVTASADSLAAGSYTGTITIASNDPDEPTVMVWVTFTVTGGGSTTIEMVPLSGGQFDMGSDYYGTDSDEWPIHSVRISAFSMAKYEVTQGEYEEVMGSNPSDFQGTNRPVEKVTWWAAAKFCNALSEREGLTKFYNDDDLNSQASTVRMNWSTNGYRLPTEAEWEYACRAGSTTEYYWGDTIDGEYCWYSQNSGGETHDVGTRLPNAWGLHDMSGNVWEWCNDWYKSDYYDESPSQDPTGPGMGSNRVGRGGGWSFYVEGCRSAYRYDRYPVVSFGHLGFRPARR